MKILKFGGTSVGSADAISCVLAAVKKELKSKDSMWIVVSAFSGVTNSLLAISEKASLQDSSYETLLLSLSTRHYSLLDALLSSDRQAMTKNRIRQKLDELRELLHGVYLIQELSARTQDLILSYGEQLSSILIAAYLSEQDIPAKNLDTRKLIITDEDHGQAHVDFVESYQRIQNYAAEHNEIIVATGFIAATKDGITTTLGRGGSDFTASLLGAALNVEEIQIWTDVNGVMTADPRKVPEAFSLTELSFEEAMELSHFGSKVIHPPTLAPAMEKGIRLRIMNTFDQNFYGTLVQAKLHGGKTDSKHVITGISSIEHIALLRIQGSGMVGVRGISSRLFACLSRHDINIILITQASSEHSICIAVQPNEADKAKVFIEKEFELEMKSLMIDPVTVEKNLSSLAIVGENMIRTPGIAGRLFAILGQHRVNIIAIAQGSSELNISIILPHADEKRALNAIHKAFFTPNGKTVHVFQMGIGLVGSTLLQQIHAHRKPCLTRHKLNIQHVALANSKKALFCHTGIDLRSWKEELETSGKAGTIDSFIKAMLKAKLPDSLFLDCTANADVAKQYPAILKAGISIVTPNKIANSESMQDYHRLRKICEDTQSSFFYETNVGAGLPIIKTIQDLASCGEEFLKIEGVLSGTLSYIFNSFQQGGSFSSIVKAAQEKGYTEPDPRIDLGGIDVARKLLILVREAGMELELTDIAKKPLLPQDCFKTAGIDEFYETLKAQDPLFDTLRNDAKKQGKVWRYTASWEAGKAEIGLKLFDSSHPFYPLQGSENILSLTTSSYGDYPLVIKGPGAGAEVTAKGVFADILQFSRQRGLLHDIG